MLLVSAAPIPEYVSSIDQKLLPEGPGSVSPSVTGILSGTDVNSWILERDDNSEIIEFYSHFTGSSLVAETIINEAIHSEIPVHLAVSLAWRESAFNPRAVSPPNRSGTRDWGLFQLNDGFRTQWTRDDFFHIQKNTESALEYLKYCIVQTKSIRWGLAAYNAGIHSVITETVPSSTIRHISKILSFETMLDRALNENMRQST